MSAWGVGAFENNTALDWLGDLADSNDPMVDVVRALKEVSRSVQIDAESAERASAAIELVVSANDSSRASELPEQAQEVIHHCGKSLVRYRDLALDVLARLSQDDNPILLDWDLVDQGDEYSEEIQRSQKALGK